MRTVLGVTLVLAGLAAAERPFDEDRLIRVQLDISAADWDDISHNRVPEGEYRRCTFRYGSETYRDIGIRRRGEAGRMIDTPKPSVRLRFNDGAKFHGRRFLGLDGFWLDPSMLAERLAYKVNNRRGVEAPKFSHVRVYLSLDGADPVFQGLFGLEEIIREDFVKDRFGRPVGNLYRMRGTAPDAFAYRGDDPNLYVPHPFELETNEETPDHTNLLALIRALDQTRPSEFRERVGPLFDMANLLDFFAVEVLTGEVDGFAAEWDEESGNYQNNMFFYHRPSDGKFYAVPWDREASWYAPTADFSLVKKLGYSVLTRAIGQDADLQREYLWRCADILTDLDPEVILPRLDAMYAQIRESVYEDPNKPYSNEQFEQTYQSIRRYILRRYETALDELMRRFSSDEVTVGFGPGGLGAFVSFRMHDGPDGPLTDASVLWDLSNAFSGECHPARGDLDGDGFDETVVGLGSGGQGRLAVFDDPDHGGTFLAWIEVPDAEYNAANGATWPTCGDADGDGRAEIAVGLGQGGRGRVAVFQDAEARFVFDRWIEVPWADYNAFNGETRSALGDIDGDGRTELVVGLGRGSFGIWCTYDDLEAGMPWLASHVFPWPCYDLYGEGSTRPACADVDLDGRAEIVFGLEGGSGGWMLMVDDLPGHHAPLEWVQVGSDHTRPALGDMDGDGDADLVVGFGRGGSQRVELVRRSTTMGRFVPRWGRRVDSSNVHLETDGQTWPAVGHGKWIR